MNQRLPRELPLKVSKGNYMVGFHHHVRADLKPTKQGKPPTPQSVYKVLRDERPSRTLLMNIFVNCPSLLKHPCTSADVRDMYDAWRKRGEELPPEYGRRGTVCARDCAISLRRAHTEGGNAK